MREDVEDAVYGCLIGGAIGDALGAPVEGWTHERIRQEYGTLEEFKQYYMPYSNTEPGSITSDTTLRHYLCLALVEKGGRVTPEAFAAVLQEHLNPNRVWINEEIVLKKLSAGIDPWMTGRGTVPDNKVTAAITPVGVVNVGDPEQAYQDGFNVASMFQDGHDRHATATVAAGVAEAMTPGSSIESVIATMVEQSSDLVERALDLALGFAEEADSPDELVEVLYDRFLDWRWPAVQWNREKYHAGEIFSANTLEVVPVAVAMLAVCDGDVNRSLVEGVNYGRDSDAVATIAGSLAGALHGAGAIRDEWIAKCEESNRDFFEELEDDPDADFRSMAERLVGVLERERERAAARDEQLARLLGATDR
jgi:ADP-ribosylglycohydrolase